MQLKKYLCILAVAFLLFLLFLNLLHSCGWEGTDTPEMSETSPQHIPVVQKLKNVWITDAEADRITIFCDGEKETFFLEAETEGSDSVPAPEQMRECRLQKSRLRNRQKKSSLPKLLLRR